MGSINDVITALRQAPTNVDRGTLFEQLMVRYEAPVMAGGVGRNLQFDVEDPGCDPLPEPAGVGGPIQKPSDARLNRIVFTMSFLSTHVSPEAGPCP